MAGAEFGANFFLVVVVEFFEFKVDAIVGEPSVAFRETITTEVESNYRHVKQTGGKGQFAHTVMRLEPNPGKGFEFVEHIKGGAIPSEFITSVRKGLEKSLDKGILAGYPVVDVRVTLLDGSFHAVDSSDMAFQTCAAIGFKQGFMKASPILLEPIMKVEVNTPDEYIGDIVGNLNRRRGRIEGMRRHRKGSQKINVYVPLMEMFGYSTQLQEYLFRPGQLRHGIFPIHAASKESTGRGAEESCGGKIISHPLRFLEDINQISMYYNILGKTGVLVSELCLGAMTFGGKGFWTAIGKLPQEEVTNLVKIAIENGINFIDTANVYSEGQSEILLGKALKDLGSTGRMYLLPPRSGAGREPAQTRSGCLNCISDTLWMKASRGWGWTISTCCISMVWTR